MKIVVTGPTGYLARYIILHLESLGHEVITLTFNNLDPDDYELITQDAGIENCDVVINCAAAQVSGSSPNEIKELINANIYWPSVLLHALKEKNIRSSFIHIGSQWQKYDEEINFPFNYYAATKSALEPIMQHFALDGIKIAVVLLSDLVGPADYRNKLHTRVIEAFRNNIPMDTTGGEQFMNLIHVNDACSGITTAMDLTSSSTERVVYNKYNLCTANHITVKELISEIAYRMNKNNLSELIKFGALKYRDREKFDALSSKPNICGWYPQYTTNEIIDELTKTRTG